ncbi:hypothetical protein D3C75_673260 [compost metagenome]
MAVATTGFPAARYSYTFTGFVHNVSSTNLNGIVHISNEFRYPSKSLYGTSPAKWILDIFSASEISQPNVLPTNKKSHSGYACALAITRSISNHSEIAP